MEGKGTYHFPTETRYEGELKDGEFHGKGTLFFPNGSKYEASWEKGIAIEVISYVFSLVNHYYDKKILYLCSYRSIEDSTSNTNCLFYIHFLSNCK